MILICMLPFVNCEQRMEYSWNPSIQPLEFAFITPLHNLPVLSKNFTSIIYLQLRAVPAIHRFVLYTVFLHGK